MFTGRNTLLREVLDFFIDYEIKNASGKDNSEKRSEIKLKKEAFAIKAKDILEHLQGRMKAGQDHILEYAQETGASFQNATLTNPNFSQAKIQNADFSNADLTSVNWTDSKKENCTPI